MIKHLTFSGIKRFKSEWAGQVGRVTLFTGPNRSGKTAAMEAVSLAASDRCSIGSAGTKVGLLRSGPSFAGLYGDSISAVWQHHSKRSHEIRIDGKSVLALTNLPITVDDWWNSTGEDKWSLLERIVGAFDRKAPMSPAASKEQLKELRSLSQPEAYTGESLSELNERIESLSLKMNQTEGAKKAIEQAMAFNNQIAQDHQRIVGSIEIAKESESQLSSMLQKLKDNSQPIRDYMDVLCQSPSTKLGIGVSLLSCVEDLDDHIRDKAKAITDECNKYVGFVDGIEDVIAGLRHVVKATDRIGDTDCLSELNLREPEEAQKLLALLQEIDGGLTKIPFPMDYAECNQYLLSKEMSFKKEIERVRDIIKSLQDSLDNLPTNRPIPAAPLNDDEAIELKQNILALRAKADKARAWKNWMDTAAARTREIAVLEERIAALEKENSEYQKERLEYLAKATGPITELANKFLKGMGFSELLLSIQTTGKRNSITVTADGVDVAAMSGGEKLAYGVALLNAIHMISDEENPVMLIEAAEIDSDGLEAMLEMLVEHRTKGNVFVSHWAKVEVNEVVTHSFSNPKANPSPVEVLA